MTEDIQKKEAYWHFNGLAWLTDNNNNMPFDVDPISSHQHHSASEQINKGNIYFKSNLNLVWEHKPWICLQKGICGYGYECFLSSSSEIAHTPTTQTELVVMINVLGYARWKFLASDKLVYIIRIFLLVVALDVPLVFRYIFKEIKHTKEK